MPLDLKKVILQIRNIEKQENKSLNEERFISTIELFLRALNDEDCFLKKLLATQENKKANFSFAIPLTNESLNTTVLIKNNFTLPHIVISTDGSQINPSHHEISSASLINIGLIAIPYFEKNISVNLSSEPMIYNSSEEIIQIETNDRIPDEDLISFERTLREIEGIVKLAEEYKKYNLPLVAIVDGTLIHWHIEKYPAEFINLFINRFSNALERLKELNIPIAGFISNSRSNDLINMIKIYNCPYESVDCKKHCGSLNIKNLPCNPCKNYSPILDRNLIKKFFESKSNILGERTVVFKSNSKVLEYYSNDLKIYFFYLNTGSEIARIEIPAYIVNNKNLLELLENAIMLQCKVGFGYPVVLSEAHLQAVVTKKDRELFYTLIKEQQLKNNKSSMRLSQKEFKKRVSFT